MNNIVLIGMPASGKSTVGVILAKLLGYDFTDTDLLIQKQTGRRLSDILSEQGIDAFLAIEESACLSLRTERCVIATGGSVVYSAAAMTHLKAMGRVVYLEVGFDALRERLSDLRSRGVVLPDGMTLRQLYDERIPLYRRYADLTVSEGQGSLEDTVQTVFRQLQPERPPLGP